ncbi:MAG: iron-sulfur cluster assembly scaffold protein [Candidatus Shapirobacteria bacterium]|nr:iron-sulfur cluster assembly scaffold protein [Candidatus Shapirobacteria bacterium]
MDDLYKEIIIDRYQNPQNRGVVEGGVEAFEVNILCGDKLKITAKIQDGIMEDVKFEGGGCAISMASVDMLLDKIKGKKIDDIKKIKGSEIEEMLGVELTSVRKKCAYLGLEVVRKIVNLDKK